MSELVKQPENLTISPIVREHMIVAEKYALSDIVPIHFRGKPEDIFIVLQMGEALGVQNYMTALNEITPIKGKPTLSAKLAMSLAYKSGIFKGRFSYRHEGESWEDLIVFASATLNSGEKVEVNASIAMAKAEGWTNNPKYKSMPVQMLCYRAALMLIRRYAPECLLGVPVVDVEARDIKSTTVQDTKANVDQLLGLEEGEE
ncbi:MAG: hypothetical protein HRU19_12345 [Pseudobacteriovorax sp.]|nr:hypothetical protein [Pseudobacteriovorax sp.]